ncbi:MAG: response regulator [Bdellovibrio sp.]|nr:response regulator [Bdellovibrio sp.]
MNHHIEPDLLKTTEESASDSSEKIMHFLSRASSELGHSLGWEEALQQITKVIVPDLAEACSVWWLDDGVLLQKINSNPKNSVNELLSEEINDVVKTGISFLTKNKFGMFLAAPMRLRNKVIGVLTCFSSSHLFTQIDLLVAEELAFRAGMALDNAKMYQELKSTEQYLQKSRQIAELENQAKSLFLANMSHEIRTPLTAILGFLELIIAENDQGQMSNASSRRSAEMSERVRANGAHLLKLIDQILDLSKIESGKIEILNEAVNLNELLKDVYETLGFHTKRRKNNLEFHIDSTIPSWIQTDPTRLRQILINIVGNALKFTENGEVSVHISFDDSKSQLSFVVKDNGIGLTAEQKSRLFNPFTQGDASHTKKFGGTGLGLSLSRRFAQHMKGDIVLVSSEPLCGTTFEITIQATDVSLQKLNPTLWQRPDKPKYRKNEANSFMLSGVKILLAEDSPDNQMIINMILEKAGAEVHIANDGAEAFKMASENKYDIILMDIELPIMSGHQVCQKLREKGYAGPIIALTAHALKKERDQSLQYGCDAHITKPIDRYHLISTIHSYVNMNLNYPH